MRLSTVKHKTMYTYSCAGALRPLASKCNPLIVEGFLSLMMKNGLFTIQLFENDHGHGHGDELPQTTPKAEFHEKKIILSVWYDWKGVVFFELLPRNQTINSDVYCRQLNKLNAAVKEKRPELVTDIFSHSPKIIKAWFGSDICYIHHIALALHYQIIIYFDLCRTS